MSKPWPSDVVIVIAPTAGAVAPDPATRAETHWCRGCWAELAVAPASVDAALALPERRGRPVAFLCLECATGHTPPRGVFLELREPVPAAESPGAVCVRAADVPAGVPLPPGIEPATCAGCGCGVLTAPSTRRLVAARIARPVCPGCVPAGSVPVLTAAGAAELRGYRRRAAERN